MPNGSHRFTPAHSLALLIAGFLNGCLFLAGPLLLPAAAGESYISSKKQESFFTLAESGRCAPLQASSADFPGVHRVLKHLQADISRVTGTSPALAFDDTPAANEIVLIGTLGKNPLIDRLVAENKLDSVGLAGCRETFLIQVIEQPFPGVKRALVIAGSDKRGTIYGIYDLANQIGVSAWHFWADVPVRHQDALYVQPGRHTLGEPKVKYRGIFINDEAPALSGWAYEKFGGFNARFYEHVFELILRMKGNFLWPAMWGRAFYVDDPVNPQLADEYGIVISTSHHEPMMRAHAEWAKFGKGPWNYEANKAVLQEFWRQGIERMGPNESIVTIGMRGDGDQPMTEEANIALLEKIVVDQREILTRVTGKRPEQIPQVWALYKEVQEYYDKGMRVPDDVTLLLCDDNWGNIRKLPRPGDVPRSGGYGIYYHFDYVGGPRNYKWLNTNQVARVWEQMHLAYEMGVDRIWIVNVGDIKPMELPTEFFLDYAWNPDKWPAERLPEYTRLWTERQFGPEHAAEIGALLTGYTQFNGRRKPELIESGTYSLIDFGEADKIVAAYNNLADRAQRLDNLLPPESRDAFYQLVLHPVSACANLNELYVTVGKNNLYARQGRSATNKLAENAAILFSKDAEITRYYNTVLAGGKWSHMMDQTHIGYTYWQQPDSNAMPAVKRLELPGGADMGVAIEGSSQWWPGSEEAAVLPELDPFIKTNCYAELYNRGKTPFSYSVRPGKKWLKISAPKGIIDMENRISIDVDWEKAPVGRHQVPITLTGANGRRVVIQARIHKPPQPEQALAGRFIESNGYVAMEAEHYARAVNSPAMHWQRIPELGRTLSGMTPFPVDAPAQEPGGASTHLEYQMHLFSSGEVTVKAFLSPTLIFHHNQGLRYAVSLNDETPQIINLHAGQTFQDWEESVRANIIIKACKHLIAKPGLQVLKYWAVDPGVVLQKLVVETGGAKPAYLGPPESFVVPKQAPRQVQNPILSGFYPDPSICRVGEEYYLVTSSFAYFPGIPIFRSRDLVNWQQIGHVMDRPEQLDLEGHGVSRGLFAPAIRRYNGRFYVTCTLVDRGGNFVVTSESAEGPWSNPVWLPEINGIDPSLFFDDDGKAYIIYNSIPPDDRPLYDGHRTIRMVAFDAEKLCVTGTEGILVNGGVDLTKKPVWIEAPHIFRKEGWYYLIAAEGGTAEQHSEVVFRSRAVDGPYIPWVKNPILTQRHLDSLRKAPVTSTGHADLVETPEGNWYAVFLGCRPYAPFDQNYYNTGRETFMAPVAWQEGWPVINPDYVEIQTTYPAPLPLAPAHSPLLFSGAFHIRDEFEAGSLAPNWVYLRTPHEAWHDFTTRPGSLAMKLRPESCSGTNNPSFLGHRQQHLHGSASTCLEFMPTNENEKAGLVIFHNETHYYYLCKSLHRGKSVIQLYQSADGKNPGEPMRLLKTAELKGATAGSKLQLKIGAEGGSYSFYYAEKTGQWKPLLDRIDGTFISTRVAGGFVGCLYGLYATSLGMPSATTAYFDWFDYEGDDSTR